MIAYHGSNSNFRKLKIDKKLVKSESTLLNEGVGIYFSLETSVAKSYGKYLYTLNINDSMIRDFRKIKTCTSYVKGIVDFVRMKSGIDIRQFINVNETIQRLNYGDLAVIGIGRELELLLDSTEKTYRTLNEKQIDTVYKCLRACDKHVPSAYLFNYNIKNIGIIKDASDSVVQIVDKQRVY